MRVVGIDPGLSGGIACIATDGQAEVWKMPETEADISHLFSLLCSTTQFAVIEKVHSMPRQGVSSTFKFGRNYGFLRGLLIAYQIPFDEVSPQAWQKGMGCLCKGDKNITKAKAQQLFPRVKITHATADALLIAEFGRRTRGAP